MTLLKLFKHAKCFYSELFPSNFFVTLSCLLVYLINGNKSLVAIIWFKFATIFAIFYYYNIFKKKEFYYYFNLGITKTSLFLASFFFDFFLFGIAIFLSILKNN